MNKHLFGLIIFSFIVGTSAVIAGMFVKLPPIPTLSPVSETENYEVYRGRKHCKHKKRKPRPKAETESATVQAVQAVYDLESKELKTQLMVERFDETSEKFNVALHFFVNDGFAVQHIATEFVSVRPNFDMGDTASAISTSTFRWLENLESRENLYVIAKITDYSPDRLSFPAFNAAEAQPVVAAPIARRVGTIIREGRVTTR